MMLAPATSERSPAIRYALEEAALPASDLRGQALRYFLVGLDVDQVAMCVGFERFGHAGLVRSMVVAESRRGAGEGSRMRAAVEQIARRLGIDTLWLLTTTAAPFFTRHGDRPAGRDDAPEAIRRSAEFASLCPSGAACLSKRIAEGEA